jgi:hypothetical protein
MSHQRGQSVIDQKIKGYVVDEDGSSVFGAR